jgi:hypothetical protein
MIRLIAGLVLAGTLAVSVAAGASTSAVTAVTPSTTAGRVLAGLVQVLFVAAAIAALIVMLRYHRFRLLGSLAAGAVVASVVLAVIVHLAGGTRPRDLAAGGGRWWLTDTSLAGAALLAATVAGTVIVAPLLGRPWRRTAWTALSLATVVLLIADTASPVEVLLAFAAGVAIGAGVLILFGAAGPTSASMSAGPAVSAVLLYRLATYWFPVVPGWLSWQVLQRREYV